MAQEVFHRYELKFIIDEVLYQRLLEELEGYVAMDQYGDAFGYYHITNLYFDTENHLFYQETVNQQDFRQKLRLRVYNQVTPDSNAFLEIKKKYQGVVLKRRTALPLQKAYEFLGLPRSGGTACNAGANPQILGEIAFLKEYYRLVPKVVVCYRRQAFFGKEEADLRITFDRDLRKRETDLVLEKGPWGDSFLEEGLYIMEIKVDNRVPLWLCRILSRLQCWRKSYSKYTSSLTAESGSSEAAGTL